MIRNNFFYIVPSIVYKNNRYNKIIIESKILFIHDNILNIINQLYKKLKNSCKL